MTSIRNTQPSKIPSLSLCPDRDLHTMLIIRNSLFFLKLKTRLWFVQRPQIETAKRRQNHLKSVVAHLQSKCNYIRKCLCCWAQRVVVPRRIAWVVLFCICLAKKRGWAEPTVHLQSNQHLYVLWYTRKCPSPDVSKHSRQTNTELK